MNSIFGDATTVVATPQTLAEAESIFSGNRSPVPSIDLRSSRQGPDSAIPGLDIEPPEIDTNNGKSQQGGEASEGVGGWISNMVSKGKGDSASGKYKPVGQEDSEE
jgi:hypothetical protein